MADVGGRTAAWFGAVAGKGVALLVLLLTPANAWALCPNCLGQRASVSPTLELIGLFLLLPFVIAYAVLRVIRRACRELSGAPESSESRSSRAFTR